MIEIATQLDSPDDLFDRFDPSPNPRRRLNGELESYLLVSLKLAKTPGPVVVTINMPQSARSPETEAALGAAISAHFSGRVGLATADIKRIQLIARIFIPLGIVIMCLCMIASELLTEGAERHFRRSIGEGIIVLGWVALWAPFEHLLFNRFPIIRERSYYRRLADAQVKFDYRP
jgi:hypothetical protein